MSKNQIAYISGPMTGLNNFNFDSFNKAQKKLEKDGWIVLNPHEIAKELYIKWAKNPPTNDIDRKNMWQEFMKEDIKHLTLADSLFLLKNWETSRGATLELLIAQKLSIPIYYIENYEPFDITFQIIKLDRVPL